MITEDYVSFEVAKLLKEKGFEILTGKVYDNQNKLDYQNVVCWQENRLPYISAPTHQMAMKWLREEHKISIEITSTGYLIDGDATWGCDIKAGHRLYYQHITNKKSYESCVEAALKYSLENLI